MLSPRRQHFVLQGEIPFVIFGKINGGRLRRNPSQGIVFKLATLVSFLTDTFFPANNSPRFCVRGKLTIGAAGVYFFSKKHESVPPVFDRAIIHYNYYVFHRLSQRNPGK